jgi:hypothetical protein
LRVFDRPGPANTDELIRLVAPVCPKYRHAVVASITGNSALRLSEKTGYPGIICVTCPQGMCWETEKMDEGPFAEIPELARMRNAWLEQGLSRVAMGITEENRTGLDAAGIRVVQGTIPLFGPTFSMRVHLKKTTDLDIMAKTLELFSTGTLVCLETVLMAVDAGAIAEGEEVIALAGTERGLDTAWIIRGSASHNLFHPSKGARFVELLAKPAIPLVPDVAIEYLR